MLKNKHQNNNAESACNTSRHLTTTLTVKELSAMAVSDIPEPSDKINNIVKVCTKCGEEKSLADFSKDKNKKYGYGSSCKKCKAKSTSSRYRKYYQENKERVLAKNKLWRIANLEKTKATSKAWQDKNKNKCLKKANEHRDKKLNWFWSNVDPYCRHCQYDGSIAALQLHHLDPSQKEHGKDHLSYWIRKISFKEFKKKVSTHKFLILCANCHAELHAGLWNVGNDPWSDGGCFGSDSDE